MFLLSASNYLKDIFSLMKPKITLTATVVSIGGMMVSANSFFTKDFIVPIFGIFLLISGAGSFNMYIEESFDALMFRTQNRPIPSGRVKKKHALVFSIVLIILALVVFFIFSDLLTLSLSLLSLVCYLLIYTPLKRVTPFALFFGAIPGALPVLIGYSSLSGSLDIKALVLFLLTFFWQLPHFIAINIFRENEYVSAGYPVLFKILGLRFSKFLMLFFNMLFVVLSLALGFVAKLGIFYVSSSVLMALVFSVYFVKISKLSKLAYSRKFFFGSLFYQFLIFATLGFDFFLR